jgi:hypothetical protein
MALSLSDLDAIEARCHAAMAGPWEVTESGSVTAAGEPQTWATYVVASVGAYDRRVPSDADAEFIANARRDVPRLLRTVRSQQILLEDLARELRLLRAHTAGCERCQQVADHDRDKAAENR